MGSRLPHAILLKGAAGIGKLDFATNLAQSLLCEKPLPNGMPCESCPSCRWFEQGTHPDFRLLQPEALAEIEETEERDSSKKKPSRQISINQIRGLSDFSGLSAHRGGHRVVLIHPAEAMNPNAANALLKTLEEPSAGILIVLVSHKPQQLLPTILSRCLALGMPMPSPRESETWLRQRGIEKAGGLLAQASFAPLAAARLADESAEGDSEYVRLLQELRQPAKFDAFAVAEQLQKTEPAQVVHWLQQWCYDLACAKFSGKVRYHPELLESIKGLSAKINPFDLLQYQKDLVIARREASHPLNQKLQFEALLLGYRNMMVAS